jgi:hypothetical protein
MGAAAEPRDGCEAYFHYREEWENVKRVGLSIEDSFLWIFYHIRLFPYKEERGLGLH